MQFFTKDPRAMLRAIAHENARRPGLRHRSHAVTVCEPDCAPRPGAIKNNDPGVAGIVVVVLRIGLNYGFVELLFGSVATAMP